MKQNILCHPAKMFTLYARQVISVQRKRAIFNQTESRHYECITSVHFSFPEAQTTVLQTYFTAMIDFVEPINPAVKTGVSGLQFVSNMVQYL